MEEVIKRNLVHNCKVEIINTAIKNNYDCDLLILDECHLFASDQFRQIFTNVSYKFILCLTGTLERLDGKEKVIKQYAPVCDVITLKEAEANG